MNSTNSTTTRVFVYGTLRSGQGNHRLLAGSSSSGLVRTTPEYSMVSCGMFPAIAKEGGTAILGEVYEVDAKTLERLDRLEGVPNHYFRDEITIEDGSKALAYFYPVERIAGRDLILSGDWVDHHQEAERSGTSWW